MVITTDGDLYSDLHNRMPTGHWAAYWSTYFLVASIISTTQMLWALACMWCTYLLVVFTTQSGWALGCMVVYLPPISSYRLYSTKSLDTGVHVVYLPPSIPNSFYSTEPLDTWLHNSIERQPLHGHNHWSCPEVKVLEWVEWKAEMGEIKYTLQCGMSTIMHLLC